ncbi:hypothetical protein DPX16_22796 [Anabarilius grahami]|uniref:Uncharacterized protein n=1 Tax=Anabarilius grahami TaxID=495550 RepID=A0A3N0YRH8_ANAGA|nr:hypothetical protein DPX16_22796 [Anabarilius grahami]
MLTFDGVWNFGDVFSSWMNPGFYTWSADEEVQVMMIGDDGEMTRKVSAGVETGGSWELESKEQGICDNQLSTQYITIQYTRIHAENQCCRSVFLCHSVGVTAVITVDGDVTCIPSIDSGAHGT